MQLACALTSRSQGCWNAHTIRPVLPLPCWATRNDRGSAAATAALMVRLTPQTLCHRQRLGGRHAAGVQRGWRRGGGGAGAAGPRVPGPAAGRQRPPRSKGASRKLMRGMFPPWAAPVYTHAVAAVAAAPWSIALKCGEQPDICAGRTRSCETFCATCILCTGQCLFFTCHQAISGWSAACAVMRSNDHSACHNAGPAGRTQSESQPRRGAISVAVAIAEPAAAAAAPRGGAAWRCAPP
jgi:hypothetical protein